MQVVPPITATATFGVLSPMDTYSGYFEIPPARLALHIWSSIYRASSKETDSTSSRFSTESVIARGSHKLLKNRLRVGWRNISSFPSSRVGG